MSREPERMEKDSMAFKREPSVENSPRLHSARRSSPITTQDSTEAEAHSTVSSTPEDEEERESSDVIKAVSSRLCNSAEPASELSATAENPNGVDQTYNSSLTYTDTICDVQPANPPLDFSDRQSPIDLREPDATHDNLFLLNNSPPHLQPSSAPVAILPEDPMAGMIALVTASELPQAGVVSSYGSELCPGVSLLESTALEGMALLSQMAELEMQRQPREDTQGRSICSLLCIMLF